MRRLSLHLLALLLGITCVVSPAALRAEEGRSVPVRLVSPRAGATLTAGSTVELEWTPLAGLGEVEEWEAFLSLDGGRTYPVRITPHLDLDLRRVQWRVPDVATESARLLLRFGDERRETELELPHRFAIVPAPVPPPVAGLALARVAPSRGEPARSGHAGVVSWMEGSRRGGSLRPVVAAVQPGFRERIAPPESHTQPALLASGHSPLPLPRPVRGGLAQAPPPRRHTPHTASPLASSDILLLIQRQNE
ncbi:MAG TPA: hypothetical protein VGP73_18730 [Thermoanaerobaculia bacterium]